MQVVSNSINKIGVKLTRCGISSLEFFNVIVSGITEESFLLVLGQKSRNLTSWENHIDVFQKFFFLDLRISEDEAAVLAESTCDLEVFLYVFLKVLLCIVFNQLDLLILHSLNECWHSCEGLFSTTSHTDQQGWRSLLPNDTDNLKEMLQGINEQHQL